MFFNRKLKKELEDAKYWQNHYKNRCAEYEEKNSKLLKKLNHTENDYADLIKKHRYLESELNVYKKFCKIGEEPSDDIKEKIFKDIKILELKEQLQNTNQLLLIAVMCSNRMYYSLPYPSPLVSPAILC